MFKTISGFISIFLLFSIITLLSIWYFSSPTPTIAEKNTQSEAIILPAHEGKYVLIHLDTMTLELKDGATTLALLPVISKGKPGSYYETIGGYYINDYKEISHFSTIGHVYMPYSVHVFGNFFIHGIPYFEDGIRVSSSYSGGCIRLEDDSEKMVYDFVKKGTPIIITKNDEHDFTPSATTTPNLESIDIVRFMVATISLEFLTQDNELLYNNSSTTRRTLIPRLLHDNEDNISLFYSKGLGEKTFIDYMNKKAKSIGLTNTVFTNTTSSAQTTHEDYNRFMNYIDNYKSYLKADFIQ